MEAPGGRLLFLFNHGSEPARARLRQPLARPSASVREPVTGAAFPWPRHRRLDVDVELPPQSVRVFRVDY
jgi:hypothetical protein